MTEAEKGSGPEEHEATALRPADRPPSRASEPRFTPGALLAERYRIIALLGRGGMGEVYRADDIKLGQPVALKFLPRSVGGDPQKIERLYQEVRIGRQVSHPNVCRLYDVGEWEGNHFLAMEYVDGEDLASLLRRIGRLPENKALDIARDLCAGLAAAHGLGIIHRDLKPANIMIDGRGQARITDFGLAGLATELSQNREIAGTPAYMAPEQLKGGEVSVRTDLYALGLILYEMFTGKRRFESKSLSELIEEHSSTRSQTPSAEMRLIEPAVQRAILRCLEEDPQQRPASIHVVIASLPGGDPLQAAIDAGETPSPEMVAATGAIGDISPLKAWGALTFALAALLITTMLASRVTLYGLADLPKSPEVLRERAREILNSLGYENARDSAIGLGYNEDFFKYISEKDRSPDRWKRFRSARPGVMQFAYRQSPRTLEAWGDERKVWPNDPPSTVPGMAAVRLDPQGRLIRFEAVPPQRTDASGPTPIDWKPLFAHAGLDVGKFRPVSSVWTAPSDSDLKQAWEGHYPDQPADPIHIEAAAYRGRPVWFAIFGAWDKPEEPVVVLPGPNVRIGQFAFLILGILSIIVCAVLARRNLRRGRGDRKGAFRTATFVFAVSFIARVFRMDHVSSLDAEWELLEDCAALALYDAALLWLFYIAIEPYVRRKWPHVLISWSRFLAGRVRDPMVGRDLLAGVAGGIVMELVTFLTILAPTFVGQAPLPPIRRWTSPLAELSQFIYAIFLSLSEAVEAALSGLVIVFLLLLVLRKRSLALAVLFLLITLTVNVRGDFVPLEMAFGAIIAITAIILLTRFGLLALTVAIFLSILLDAVPLTFDASSWYFGRSLVSLALITGLAVYGFFFALGDKPLFGKPLLED